MTEQGTQAEQRMQDDQKLIENLESYKTRMESELENLKTKLAEA